MFFERATVTTGQCQSFSERVGVVIGPEQWVAMCHRTELGKPIDGFHLILNDAADPKIFPIAPEICIAIVHLLTVPLFSYPPYPVLRRSLHFPMLEPQ
jgi:hypothetical protein